MQKIVEEISGLLLGSLGTIAVLGILSALLGENGLLREMILSYLGNGI